MEIDPEQERRRLAELYATFPDATLQDLAQEPAELTSIARAVLAAELNNRGISLDLPSAVDPESTQDHPDDKLVLLCSFRDVGEALLAQTTLQSAGIQSFLSNENIVRMIWAWSNAMGGVKLMVREEDVAQAEEVLDQPIPETLDVPGVGEYQQPACPSCGSLETNFEELNKRIAYSSVIIGFPLPVQRRGWRCESCGQQWDDDADRE